MAATLVKHGQMYLIRVIQHTINIQNNNEMMNMAMY
jgi:hypothetical protein